MEKRRKRVVIFGGAFNPPHVGHMMMIEAASRLFPCDALWVMPSKDRGDKKVSATGEDRMAMLALMVEELSLQHLSAPIVISDFELRLPGLTKTIETKEALESTYPEHDFYFLIGSDVVKDIQTKWVRGEELWSTGRFVIASRIDEIPLHLPSHSVVLREVTRGADISSTFVREIVATGALGVPYLTPQVAQYIKQHRLYQNEMSAE